MTARKGVLLSILITLLLFSGCSRVYVKDVQVDNSPVGTVNNGEFSGVPVDQLQYFKDIYPPETWTVKMGGSSVAVGPVLISEEAMLYLEGDSSSRSLVSGRPESGSSKDMITVRDSEGRTIFFKLTKKSFEAQAIVAEEIVNVGNLKAVALDKKTAEEFSSGARKYKDLLRKNIHYYVVGNLVVDVEGEKEIRLYLRMINAANDKIICAVSTKGTNLDIVSRKAAISLLKRMENII